MSNLKVDKYYDLQCDICGLNRSTDTRIDPYRTNYTSRCYDGGYGMETSLTRLRKFAKKEGWRLLDGKNHCPICVEKELIYLKEKESN